MFFFTIQLDPKLSAQVDRALDYLEGAQQTQIDAFTTTVRAQTLKLKGSSDKLKTATDAND